MVDKEKILAGRKMIEAYGEAHNLLHSKPWHRGIPEEHTPLLEKMLSQLKGLGFNSLEEFYDANKEANYEALFAWAEYEGNCDSCVGRQTACDPTCYNNLAVPLSELDAPTPTGKKVIVAGIDLSKNQDVRFRIIIFWEDYYREKATANVGDVFPIFPGCSILRRVKAKPELDFLWR